MTTNRHGLMGCLGWVAAILVVQSLWFSATAAQPRVFGWGDNSYGQSIAPAALTNVVAIAAGYYHSLVLRSNGTVVAWGDNSAGQTNNQPSLTNVMAIDAGAYHNLALRSNGTVFAWGQNNLGQLNWPAGLANVAKISGGGDHSMALRSNGTVVVWGDNSSTQTNVPSSATNVVAISAGHSHCLALKSNGTIVAWGDNDSGQSTVPGSVTNIKAIAAGYHHNLAVRSNGTVAAWGVNVYGETDVPPGLSNVVAVAAGYFHSAALRSDGTVVAWGQDFSGVTNVPAGLTSVTELAAGWEFDLALSFAPLCPPGFPDNFECRQTLTGSNLTFQSSNVGATYEPNEPKHYTVTGSNSIWYEWTAPFAGGVVVQTEAPSSSGYFKPIVAVYTGNNLASLIRQTYNSTASNSSGGAPIARAAFTAVAGQTYEIAFDGLDEGSLTNKLVLSLPPANDLFAAATPIAGAYYGFAGSFIGASREAGEPGHGNVSFGQTLWWTWVAPANGPNPLSVRLTADAVNFPPAVAVYTGNAIASLVNVTLATKTNGMTTDAILDAVPGTTYYLALAGKQNDPDSVAPVIGNFRFRLNVRALALSITNFIPTTNGGAISFQANARVQNLGTTTSGPLRVSVSSISGLSTTQPISSTPISTITNLSITNLPSSLTPGQSTLAHISGIAPAPQPDGGFDQSKIFAYGVYAELQEQPVANRWFTVDQTLVTFDDWPAIGNVVGPGGGVIRLDPDYLGLSAFNPLQTVIAVGPASVTEGTSANYTGKATFTDATIVNFTNTAWTASRFTIATNGLFTSGNVTSNSVVTINAPYSSQGLIHNASTNVTVINLPPPTITNLSLLGDAGIVFTLSGVAGRSNVIEATTNLAAPAVWLPLITNAPASGLFNFTNFSRTNFPHRFYRGREM